MCDNYKKRLFRGCFFFLNKKIKTKHLGQHLSFSTNLAVVVARARANSINSWRSPGKPWARLWITPRYTFLYFPDSMPLRPCSWFALVSISLFFTRGQMELVTLYIATICLRLFLIRFAISSWGRMGYQDRLQQLMFFGQHGPYYYNIFGQIARYI